MQFKHPEILYFSALIIIPILVHLFQLQRFVKTPFTNVAFLKHLAQETRKSSRLKKWLLLATRILLFLAILFAFSQPYFSAKNADKKQQTFIYLDNSLSTNTKGERGDLLQIAAQEIIENSSINDRYSLLTNSNFYENISNEELKKTLQRVKNTSKKLSIESVLLKIKTQNTNKTNTLVKNILISDFQNSYENKFTNVTPSISLINLKPAIKNNISIDSVYIENKNSNNSTVNIKIRNQGEAKTNTPIALYNDTKLISKQSFSIEKNSTKIIPFTIESSGLFLGKIDITFNDTFTFDNSFYFSKNSNQKINVLAIGNHLDFLQKIYSETTFNFTKNSLQDINYNTIPKQQLIILNEVEKISPTLTSSLVNFSKNGGNIVMIPNSKSDINSYNLFLKNLNIGKINPIKKDTLKITNINYSHPIFADVFSKEVQNFQYPTANNRYPTSFKNTSSIISFENNEDFIQQVKLENSSFYWISSSLQKENSNFTNSPLIVPVFYNFGSMSLQNSKLYYTLDKTNTIDIDVQLEKNEILTIANPTNSFIPLQQTQQNKTTITTKEQPTTAGFYTISSKEKTITNIAFNNPKEESSLNYLDITELAKTNENITVSASIKDVFQEINKKNEVSWLWKWFLTLAIVSLLLEILILKFFKV